MLDSSRETESSFLPMPWRSPTRGTIGLATLRVAVRVAAFIGLSTSALGVTATAGEAVALSIPAIQGTGERSPHEGVVVSTQGVVTLRVRRGFYLQDPEGDGDPRTSDGLFVHTGGVPKVAVGDAVRVTGTVAEFGRAAPAIRESDAAGTPAGSSTLERTTAAAPVRVASPAIGRTQTELTRVSVARTGDGAAVPVRRLRLADEVGAVALERVEGMRVRVAGPLAVLVPPRARGDRALTVGCHPRPRTPTDTVRPGDAAWRLAEAQALCRLRVERWDVVPGERARRGPEPAPDGGDDASESDDGLVSTAWRAGDVVSDLDGVVGDGAVAGRSAQGGLHRLHPLAAPRRVASNATPAIPPAVGGTVTVAAANVQNFFVTLNDGRAACFPGSPRDCRGARTPEAYQRQLARTTRVLAGLDADVIGLVEVENGSQAVAALTAALNARAGALPYAPVSDVAPAGRDAIQVTLLYRPARLSLVGASRRDVRRVHDRPPLAQAFRTREGHVFSVVVSHLKSKRCDRAAGPQADAKDGQGCYNARRREQAAALGTFATAFARDTGSADVLLVGDLNAYALEDPLRVLREDFGFTDQLARFESPRRADAYTYVFDGVAGRLDHVLASPSLSRRVRGASAWHVNADVAPDSGEAGEGGRSADHDPVRVGLDFGALPHAGR